MCLGLVFLQVCILQDRQLQGDQNQYEKYEIKPSCVQTPLDLSTLSERLGASSTITFRALNLLPSIKTLSLLISIECCCSKLFNGFISSAKVDGYYFIDRSMECRISGAEDISHV